MKYIFLLIFSLTITFSNAQDNPTTSWGIKAGINLANHIQPNGGGFTDFKSGFGFYIGGAGYFPLSNTLGLAGELIMSKTSSTLELETSSFDISDFDPVIGSVIQSSDYNQTILQLPLLVQVNLIKIVGLQAGTQLSYIMGSEFEGFDNEESFTIANEDMFGVDLVTGFNIRLSEPVHMNGRYYFGLTKRNDLKPSVFQFGFSYNFK